MTNTNTNENIANKLIAAVMSSEQAAGNRYAQLVGYMFENEVTYAADELLKFFKEKGSDRVALIQQAIVNISDDYENVLKLYNALNAEKKANKDNFTDAKALQVEQLNLKLRAANQLFIRACTGVYHLRAVEAYGVKVRNNGSITFMYDKRDDKGQPVVNSKGNPVSGEATMSGNALVRAGEKSLEKVVPKKAAKVAAAGNPAVKAGMGPIAAVIADRVKQQLAAGNVDFADDDQKELDRLLHQLMAAKFLDDKGQVDRKTVIEYLDLEFPKAEAKNKAA